MNAPVGLSGLHGGGAVAPGRSGFVSRPGASNIGVQSSFTLRGFAALNEAYGELRRLNILGLRLPIVRVARNLALSCSTRAKCRLRRVGRVGGKSPGWGLFSSQQLYVAGEGRLGVRYPVSRCPFVQQPTHRVVRQHPAAELLPDQLGGLAAQNAATLEQVCLEFVEHRFDLPPLVVQRRQLERWRLLWISLRPCLPAPGQPPDPLIAYKAWFSDPTGRATIKAGDMYDIQDWPLRRFISGPIRPPGASPRASKPP